MAIITINAFSNIDGPVVASKLSAQLFTIQAQTGYPTDAMRLSLGYDILDVYPADAEKIEQLAANLLELAGILRMKNTPQLIFPVAPPFAHVGKTDTSESVNTIYGS